MRHVSTATGGQLSGLTVTAGGVTDYDVDYAYDPATGRMQHVTGPGPRACAAVGDHGG